MRIFLYEFGVSIVTSILFWNFGLARHIWPAHPILCTTLLAMLCGMVTHYVLKYDARPRR